MVGQAPVTTVNSKLSEMLVSRINFWDGGLVLRPETWETLVGVPVLGVLVKATTPTSPTRL